MPLIPPPRRGYHHHFHVAGTHGTLTTIATRDHTLMQVHATATDEAAAHTLETISSAITLGLRAGVSLEHHIAFYLVHAGHSDGRVSDLDLGYVHSLPDYLARRLAVDYLPSNRLASLGLSPLLVA